MANVKISELPSASTPLTGAELVPVVQSGVTSQTTVDNLLNPLAETNGSSLVAYLPSGTNAVATTVQAKLRETVSVKDFGAVGDGVTDDTAAIQAAINSNASEIIFPKGIYLSSGITVSTSEKTITGVGTIYLKSGSNTNSITINANNVNITNIKIDGNRIGQTLTEANATSGVGNGVYVSNGFNNVIVKNCSIENTALSGIAGYGNHENCVYTDNYINNAGYMGIFPSFSGDRPFLNGIISRNKIIDPGQINPVLGGGDGIGTVAMQHCTISDNIIINPKFAGIAIEYANAFLTISGNIIDGESSFTSLSNGAPQWTKTTKGIQINDCWNITVVGNVVKRCAIGLVSSGDTYTKNVIFSANTIESCCDGIALDALNPYQTIKTTVIGNTISNSWGRPIYAIKQCEGVIEGNLIEGVNLSNATAQTYRYGIVVAGGTTKWNISNNKIFNDSSGKTGYTYTGYMSVGIGEMYFAGYTPEGNVIFNNYVTGASVFQTITLDRGVFTSASSDNNTRITRVQNSNYTAAPTTGAWKTSDISYRQIGVAGGYIGDVCTTYGQFITLSSVTATVSASSTTVTFNDCSLLVDGMQISIAGAGIAGAALISGIMNVNAYAKTATLKTAASTTVSSAAVTSVSPVFKAFGAILP